MAYKVLLVEDDPDTLELFKSYLEVRDFETATATNGEEALQVLKRDRFDLMITDIKMPRMSGIELIRRSREFTPHLPTVIVSGAGTLSEAAEAVNLKVFHYLHKPITDLEELRRVALDAIIANSPYLAEENQQLKNENAFLKSVLLETYRMPDFGMISSGSAHNINSPLGGVMGYAQLIGMNNPEIKGIAIISEQTLKISKYIALIGDKGGTETNYEKTNLDLKNLIEREAEYLNFNLYYKHQVDKSYELDSVPQIYGIYHHFSQIFHHLMQNALHAVYETNKKQIIVSLKKKPALIELKITDSGIGIPDEDIDKIFTIGFTTKPKPWEVEEPEIPSGYGLGLYIVREILKLYKGELYIESALKTGSTVTVKIPVEK
jgi:signal transduction histidine kinase